MSHESLAPCCTRVFNASARWFAYHALFVVIALGPLVGQSQEIGLNPEWKEPVEGFAYTTLDVARPALFSSKLVTVRASLKTFRPVTLRAIEYGRKRSDVKFLALESDAWAAINANFFDEHGDPLGLVVTRGNLVQDVHRSGSVLSGVFLIDRLGPHIVNRSEFSPKRALEAIQAGPRLIVDGAPVPGLRNPEIMSRRSVVCITDDDAVLLLASSTRFDRFSLAELQTLLVHPALRCRAALNLDGGGSSQLFVRGASEMEALSVEGDDPVPVALGLVKR